MYGLVEVVYANKLNVTITLCINMTVHASVVVPVCGDAATHVRVNGMPAADHLQTGHRRYLGAAAHVRGYRLRRSHRVYRVSPQASSSCH